MAAELCTHVKAGHVKRAREILSILEPEVREHPTLARWVRALRPPQVRVGAAGSTSSVQQNVDWLHAHAADHAGEWVALRDGKLLGAHADYAELYRNLEQRAALDGALFVRLTKE